MLESLSYDRLLEARQAMQPTLDKLRWLTSYYLDMSDAAPECVGWVFEAHDREQACLQQAEELDEELIIRQSRDYDLAEAA